MGGNAIAFMGAGLGLGLVVIGAGLGIGKLAAGAAEAIGASAERGAADHRRGRTCRSSCSKASRSSPRCSRC